MQTVLITTMCMQLPGSDINYIESTRRMIESYLNHTNHPILLVTNVPAAFDDILLTTDGHLTISYMPSGINRFNRFDYTLKMEAIAQASTANVDAVYWVDGDLYTEGWHEESFQELLKLPYDVIINSPYTYKSLEYAKNIKHVQTHGAWVPEDGEEIIPTHIEDRIIYKNLNVLRDMVYHWRQYDWDNLLQLDPDKNLFELTKGTEIEDWRTAEGSDGMIMASTLYQAGGTHMELPQGHYEFADYERVVSRASLYKESALHNRFWDMPIKEFADCSKSDIGIDAYDNPTCNDLRQIFKEQQIDEEKNNTNNNIMHKATKGHNI